MTRWQLFTPLNIATTAMDSLIVIRYPSGKCNVGLLDETITGKGILLLNHVGTHFAEYKPNTQTMFTVLALPETDVVVRDSQLPLT